MRTKGSCRFRTYYKAQVWIPRQMAWQDIQKQFPTAEEARQAFPRGQQCRVMEVSEKGRAPLSQ